MGKDGRYNVEHKADRTNDDDKQRLRHLLRVQEALDRLEKDAQGEREQEDAVEEGADELCEYYQLPRSSAC